MATIEEQKELGDDLAKILDAAPRAQHGEILTAAIGTIIDGLRIGVVAALNDEIRELLGDQYAGPGKLRDRVRALEALERVAREVLVDSYDPILARGALLAALVDIDAKPEAPKAG